MRFFKKNLLICLVGLVCLAAFCAGSFLAFQKHGEIQDEKRSLNGAKSQLTNLLGQNPAPTKENLQLAEENLAELRDALARIREDLQRGANLSLSEDGVSVMAGIQQYITKFQRMAARHENDFGLLTPVETPNNFAFGFEQYIDEAAVLEDAAKVAVLDKQHQILDYVITRLIAADPKSIDVVRREILEFEKKNAKQGFSISPAVSARVPGAINTMAFSLTFSGYSDSLREFLNSLADFELPVVVRSVEVKRPSGSETVVAPSPGDGGAFFSLFEDPEPEPENTASDSSGKTRKPVIEENISKFTVILEFIEVVLPELQDQDVS